MMNKLRMRLILWLWPGRGFKSCCGRFERSIKIGKTLFTLQQRDLRKPDHYSREECYEMLRKVRRMENLWEDDWKCPEPEYREIALSAEWNNPK